MTDKKAMKPTDETALVARKRRVELRAGRGGDIEQRQPSSKRVCLDDSVEPQELAAIPGVKKDSRYVPEVPMTKQQLSAWRKEARRVRNRESAAASRRKTRERIDELEGEVSELKSKYSQALNRIMELESGNVDSFTPEKLRQDIAATVSPSSSVASSPETLRATVSPPLSPRYEHLMLPEAVPTCADGASNRHRPIDMIFRPTAV